MKTRTQIFSMALAGLILVGCSKTTYYQVFQTKAVDPKCEVKDGRINHEAKNVTVQYNFFAEEGEAGFWLTNNTDSVIYVDLSETFFVINGNANDYYQARQWTTTKSSTIAISKQERKNKKQKTSESMESSSQTSTKASTFGERCMIMVPPHATKYFSEYHINSNTFQLCGVRETPKKSKPEGVSFTEENTPLVFSNFITYTVGCKGKKQHVDDQFYISEIINVHGDAMFETVREKDACGKETGEKAQKIRYSTPDRFYLIYKK